ncbi:serine-rich adhesin for platelets-like [Drosophila tropicalis]|uniref:serine-rich adhesin for platelets-like n=1 Tax=Drosophila tropicalis TaxID=46794 RepID=UPI0035ABE395
MATKNQTKVSRQRSRSRRDPTLEALTNEMWSLAKENIKSHRRMHSVFKVRHFKVQQLRRMILRMEQAQRQRAKKRRKYRRQRAQQLFHQMILQMEASLAAKKHDLRTEQNKHERKMQKKLAKLKKLAQKTPKTWRHFKGHIKRLELSLAGILPLENVLQKHPQNREHLTDDLARPDINAVDAKDCQFLLDHKMKSKPKAPRILQYDGPYKLPAPRTVTPSGIKSSMGAFKKMRRHLKSERKRSPHRINGAHVSISDSITIHGDSSHEQIALLSPRTSSPYSSSGSPTPKSSRSSSYKRIIDSSRTSSNRKANSRSTNSSNSLSSYRRSNSSCRSSKSHRTKTSRTTSSSGRRSTSSKRGRSRGRSDYSGRSSKSHRTKTSRCVSFSRRRSTSIKPDISQGQVRSSKSHRTKTSRSTSSSRRRSTSRKRGRSRGRSDYSGRSSKSHRTKTSRSPSSSRRRSTSSKRGIDGGRSNSSGRSSKSHRTKASRSISSSGRLSTSSKRGRSRGRSDYSGRSSKSHRTKTSRCVSFSRRLSTSIKPDISQRSNSSGRSSKSQRTKTSRSTSSSRRRSTSRKRGRSRGLKRTTKQKFSVDNVKSENIIHLIRKGKNNQNIEKIPITSLRKRNKKAKRKSMEKTSGPETDDQLETELRDKNKLIDTNSSQSSNQLRILYSSELEKIASSTSTVEGYLAPIKERLHHLITRSMTSFMSGIQDFDIDESVDEDNEERIHLHLDSFSIYHRGGGDGFGPDLDRDSGKSLDLSQDQSFNRELRENLKAMRNIQYAEFEPNEGELQLMRTKEFQEKLQKPKRLTTTIFTDDLRSGHLDKHLTAIVGNEDKEYKRVYQLLLQKDAPIEWADKMLLDKYARTPSRYNATLKRLYDFRVMQSETPYERSLLDADFGDTQSVINRRQRQLRLRPYTFSPHNFSYSDMEESLSASPLHPMPQNDTEDLRKRWQKYFSEQEKSPTELLLEQKRQQQAAKSTRLKFRKLKYENREIQRQYQHQKGHPRFRSRSSQSRRSSGSRKNSLDQQYTNPRSTSRERMAALLDSEMSVLHEARKKRSTCSVCGLSYCGTDSDSNDSRAVDNLHLTEKLINNYKYLRLK